MNARRAEINESIKSTLESNCNLANGAPNKQLKSSFDTCKKKLSEVLAALKTQLEGRYKQKLEAVMQATDTSNLQVQAPPQRDAQVRVSDTNLVTQSVDPPTKLLPLGPTTLNRNDTSMISHRSPTNFAKQGGMN